MLGPFRKGCDSVLGFSRCWVCLGAFDLCSGKLLQLYVEPFCFALCTFMFLLHTGLPRSLLPLCCRSGVVA